MDEREENLLVDLLKKVEWPVSPKIFDALASAVVFIGIELCICKEKEVFLIKRPANDKFFANLWHLPGSILRRGETTRQTFHRLEEDELGFRLGKEPEFVTFLNFLENRRGHTISLVYYYTVEKTFELPQKKGNFFSAINLPENIVEDHVHIVRELATRKLI